MYGISTAGGNIWKQPGNDSRLGNGHALDVDSDRVCDSACDSSLGADMG